jgi:hypothetical protein
MWLSIIGFLETHGVGVFDAVVVVVIVILSQTVYKILPIIRKTYISSLRLELLNQIQHTPQNKQHIMYLYDEYKSAGGNSYMDDYFNQWAAFRDKG